MAETTNIERSPLVDPAPGDWIEVRDPDGPLWEVRVDMVKDGWVYVARYDAHTEEPAGLRRVELAHYQRDAVGGRVIWRTEEGTRPHCWADKADVMRKLHGDWSPAHVDAFLVSATCMRMHGHEGDHTWTLDTQIGVSFEARS